MSFQKEVRRNNNSTQQQKYQFMEFEKDKKPLAIQIFKLTDDGNKLFLLSQKGIKKTLFKISINDVSKGHYISEGDNHANSYPYQLLDSHVIVDNIQQEIVDLEINNKLNCILILTPTNLLAYDFEGNLIYDFEFYNLRKEKTGFDPACIFIDERQNNIFVGNKKNSGFYSIAQLKIKLYKDKEIESISKDFSNNSYNDNSERFEILFSNFVKYKGKVDKIFGFLCTDKTCCCHWHSKSKSINHLLITNFLHKNDSATSNEECKDEPEIITQTDDDNAEERCEDDNEIAKDIDKLQVSILSKVNLYNLQSSLEIPTKSIDSLVTGNRWDKIVLDQQIPANTSIQVLYNCFDDKNKETSNQWISAPLNSDIISLLDTNGRYLKIKIILSTSDENKSPLIKKITVYSNHSSYLKYLPAIYQENDQSKRFLEKFLAIFQNLYQKTDSEIQSFTKYIDSNATPNEYLPWLSSWISLNLGKDWTPEKLRFFLKRAPEIYKKRGTKEGLVEIISIYLLGDKQMEGTKVEGGGERKYKFYKNSNLFFITESNPTVFYNNKRKTKQSSSGTFMTTNYNKKVNPYAFYVILNPFLISKEKAAGVKHIIENEKPAHTDGIVCFMPKMFALGNGAMLGMNTILRDRGKFIVGKSITGMDKLV